MSFNEILWPQKLLGPRILNKKELVEFIFLMSRTNTLTNNLQYYIDLDTKKIKEIKQKINNNYSMSARLKNKDEVKKIYDAYVRKIKHERFKLDQVSNNISINLKNLHDLKKQLPELIDIDLFCIMNMRYEKPIIKIIPQKQWVAAELGKINIIIKQLKFELRHHTIKYNNTISTLNKCMDKI